MERRFREALTEIYEILLYIDQKSFDEIPFEVIYKITETREKEYEFKINENETELGQIIESRIKEETKEMLAYLYLEYWCTKKDEKLEKELEALRETMKLQGIYNVFTLDINDLNIYDELLRKEEIEEVVEINEEETRIVKVEKENIFTKIKNLIIKFFEEFKKTKK